MNVLITGGASGIGKSITEELAKAGAKVAICDINVENGTILRESLASKYGKEKIIFVECDVTDYTQFEEGFRTAVEDFGRLDVVINNAGILNDRLWELEVDVNLNGVIRGTLLALQYMGKNKGGHGGILVNVASITGLDPFMSAPIYSATQHAVVGLTRAYGNGFHFERTGVKVFCICPSITESKMSGDLRKQLATEDYVEAWKRETATSALQNDHVAKCLVELLSAATTGSVFLIRNSEAPKKIESSRIT